jgi:hypothetical protein
MPGLMGELRERLPVAIDSCSYRQYELLLRGDGWYFRVSGSWRLIRAGAIETSNMVELTPGKAGQISNIQGEFIRTIDFQSRIAKLDIILVLSGGAALEVFSESAYDDWLLKLGDLIIEGPMHGPCSRGGSNSVGQHLGEDFPVLKGWKQFRWSASRRRLLLVCGSRG